MEIIDRQKLEGSHISQAFVEDLDGRVRFTKNGVRFWWPKFLKAGVNRCSIHRKIFHEPKGPKSRRPDDVVG